MSAEEIIKELPRLNDTELRQVRQRLLELSAQNEAVHFANQSALNIAVVIAEMEQGDGRRQRRCSLDD